MSVCLSVCEASVSPDQISTFSNIYRHTSPLLTMYHLIPSSTNLYWPSTSQYRHILTQYHQVPLIIHHLVRHSSVNWIISLFTTHWWVTHSILSLPSCSCRIVFVPVHVSVFVFMLRVCFWWDADCLQLPTCLDRKSQKATSSRSFGQQSEQSK